MEKKYSQSTFEAPVSQLLQNRIDILKQERETLLDLGNNITKVRQKSDLINLISSRIRSLFYFSHAVVMLADPERETYKLFEFDDASCVIKNHKEFSNLVGRHFSLNAPFINQIMHAGEPDSFLLEEIINVPGSPEFLRMNFEAGMKEILMAPLQSNMETIGFLFLYSDRPGCFTPELMRLIKGIAPQLSSAVSNIVKNEELLNKEHINEVLLELSNRMVSVRNRMDLLHVINSGLKKVINFTHCVMTILDETSQTYNAFLTDPESKSKDYAAYTKVITTPNPVKDGIYDIAAQSAQPVLFDMKSFDNSKAPVWFKLHYAAGAREMMIKVLPGDGTPRHSLILFSDEAGTFDSCTVQIIERISSQLSTAASNISANEEILSKDAEKSFLLDFSQDIAAVRTKDDLEKAISSVLQRLMNTRLAMIRILDDDGLTLTPYLFDQTFFTNVRDMFNQLVATTVTINDYPFAGVLGSPEPIIFNIQEEEERGNKSSYIFFWKKFGVRKAYGAALRVGQQTVGTMWVLTDEINLNIFKGICAQISIAISNIRANEKILAYKQLLETENDHLREEIQTIYKFSEIVGSGREMQEVYHLMSRVADSSSTVLLLGETGTGKELIARAIHKESPRSGKLMIKVNCAALPSNLIESELFGHEKGAFTGASERRIGKFELANNSTLFLDEIGEMPLEAQVKLLRVLQERELERVGGKTTIKVDVRIIAATNRDLEEEVRMGRFRSDLFYRLNVFPITLPPLRNRPEDIVPLANFFVDRYSKNAGRKVTGISSGVLQELKSYPWPGNVRELEHMIERSVLLSNDTVLRDIHLPKSQNQEKEVVASAGHTLLEVERSYIIDILRRFSGKIAGIGGAADFLNVPATTLHSKMKKLKISKSDYF